MKKSVAFLIVLGSLTGLVITMGLIMWGFATFPSTTVTPPSPTEEPAALIAPPTAPAPEIFSGCGFVVSGDFKDIKCINSADGDPAGILVHTKTGWAGINFGPAPMVWIWNSEGVECKSEGDTLVCDYENGRFEVRKKGGN